MVWNVIYQPDPEKKGFVLAESGRPLPFERGTIVYVAQDVKAGAFRFNGGPQFSLSERLNDKLYGVKLGTIGTPPFRMGATFKVAFVSSTPIVERTYSIDRPVVLPDPRDLAQKLAGAQQEDESLRREVATLRSAIGLNDETKTAEEAVAALKARRDTAMQRRLDLQDTVRRLEQDTAQWQAKAEAAKARARRQREEVDQLERAPENALLLTRKRELDDLRASLQTFEEDNARLAAEIERARASADERQAEMASEQARADGLAAKTAAFRAEADERLRELAEEITARLRRMSEESGLDGSLKYISDVLTSAYAKTDADKLAEDGLPDDEDLVKDFRNLKEAVAALFTRVQDFVEERTRKAEENLPNSVAPGDQP